MSSALLIAAIAHVTARDQLVDTPTSRLAPDDHRFQAVLDTLQTLREAIAEAQARDTSDGYEFAADFLAHIERSDTDDLDFGRGLVSVGLIEKARAVLAAPPNPLATGQ